MPRRRCTLPGPPVWLWAVLSAGLPLALPFAARSVASQSGEGALATFNYAWKLVELPLILAIQLVATLAFPAIAKALARGDSAATRRSPCAAHSHWPGRWPAPRPRDTAGGRAGHRTTAVRMGTHAAAGAGAGRALGRDRRMGPAAASLDRGGPHRPGHARGRMKTAVVAYGLALALLLAYAAWGASDGAALMVLLNFCCSALRSPWWPLRWGRRPRAWLPWRSMAISFACLLALAGLGGAVMAAALLRPVARAWLLAGLAGLAVMARDLVGQRRSARRPGAIITGPHA